MNRIIWHGDIQIGPHALLFFLWWGRGSWRWPQIERLCTAGQGYDQSVWRYKIGLFDGKYRYKKAVRWVKI